jgi:transcriptional regulator with XRE-family HTH domain
MTYKERREALRLRQADIANETGLSTATISRLERVGAKQGATGPLVDLVLTRLENEKVTA